MRLERRRVDGAFQAAHLDVRVERRQLLDRARRARRADVRLREQEARGEVV
jgi:hypothetical protein